MRFLCFFSEPKEKGVMCWVEVFGRDLASKCLNVGDQIVLDSKPLLPLTLL